MKDKIWQFCHAIDIPIISTICKEGQCHLELSGLLSLFTIHLKRAQCYTKTNIMQKQP